MNLDPLDVIKALEEHKFPPRQLSPVLQGELTYVSNGVTRKFVPPKISPVTGPPSVGVEIGCGDGRLSSLILERFKDLTLYLVDNYCEETDEDRNVGDPERLVAANAAINFAGGRKILLSIDSAVASKRLGGRKFDFVIVDGDPSEEGVKSDIKNWWPMIIDGGLMIFCRYGSGSGAMKAVYDFIGDSIELKTDGIIGWISKTNGK